MRAPGKPAASKRLRSDAERLLARTPREVAQMPADDVQELVHELQVLQVETEMQNDQLRQTQLDLQQALERYSDLYNFAPTVIRI